MSHFHIILHPNDLSDTSRSAFDLACALARDYGARLIVMHVYPPPVNYADAYDRDRDDTLTNDLLAEVRKQTPHDPNLRVEYRLVEGSPAEVILEESHGCDLVVMGTHGRGGITRALMGSVAEHVQREANCPVVTVRPGVALPGDATAGGVRVGQNSLNAGM